jgi:hypothetical protein
MLGLNTSKEPKRRDRMDTARTYTGGAGNRAARPGWQTTRATAPADGEQNMYWVSGSATMAEPRMSSTASGLRRHAAGLRSPLRNALAATRASDASVIPCSCM